MNKHLKFLMEKEKLSEDEAKDKWEKMTEEEKEELRKRMGDEVITIRHDADGDGKVPEPKEGEELSGKKRMAEGQDDKKGDKKEDKKEGEEGEDNKAKLSAALKGFQEKAGAVRLKLRTANLNAKLSRLRAQAKVSPAELKKLDVAKLAAGSDETIAAVLRTYEDREPVILPGQYGTVKATSASEIAKEVKLSALEEETRANMALLRGKGSKGKAKLSEMPSETQDTKKVEETQMSADHDGMWAEIVKAVRAGEEEAGKALFSRACKMGSGEVSVDETEMASLMGAFAALEDNFSSVVRLAGATTGIKL